MVGFSEHDNELSDFTKTGKGTNYMALYTRRENSSWSRLWEHKILNNILVGRITNHFMKNEGPINSEEGLLPFQRRSTDVGAPGQ
jgi:hypothetical protein